MKPSSLLACASLSFLSLSLTAATFEFDFNDVDAGGDTTLQNAAADGGVALDGGVFTGGYDAGTGLVRLIPGDLEFASTGYTITQGPVTADGPWNVAFFDPPSHRALARFQWRDLEDFATGITWISFRVSLNPDFEADGTEGPCFGGLLIGNGFRTAGDPASTQADPDGITGAAYLGLTYIPAGMAGAGSYLEYSPGEIDFSTLGTDQTQSVRGTTSADLGLSANTTHLVIAKLDAAADQMDVWLDPANATSAATLGVPQLSTTLSLPNITCIGFGGFADNVGDAEGRDVQCNVDAVRLSNEPNAYEKVTKTPDPILAQSPEDLGVFPAIDGDLVFGTLIASGGISRRIQFINNGPANNITIEGVSLANDAGGVFSITEITDFFGDEVTFPLEMIPNDNIDIVVTFDPAGATGEFTAELLVDTNEDTPENPQDKVIAISATELAQGQKISVANSNFEAEPFSTDWVTDRVTVGGGLAAGSSQSAHLDPAGDGFLISPFPGVSDLMVSFYFAAPAITAPARGNSNILFALRGPPFNRIVTVAYFPAGVDNDPTPGWYIFTTFWNLLPGLGTIAGSVDVGDDGSLDEPGDTKRVYKFTLTGTGFGDFGASYDLAVTGINGAPGGGSSSNLTDFEQLSPNAAQPNSIAFEQRDAQLTSAITTGLTAQAGPWIDDVCVLAGTTTANPDLVVANSPNFGLIDLLRSEVDQLVLRNEGTSDLSVSDITFADSHFRIIPSPSFPSVIAPGGIQSWDVEFDPAGAAGAFVGDITITSDDSLTPVLVIPLTGESGNLDDPNFRLVTPPSFPVQIDDDSAITADLVVGNSGLANTLTVSAVTFGGPAAANFSLLTPLPLNLTPGADGTLTIQFERGTSAAGTFNATATLTTNDTSTSAIDVALTAVSLADSGPLLANCDFESQDGSPFEAWEELTSTNLAGVVEAVPGLLAGSATSAYLNGSGARLRQAFGGSGVGNFVLDAEVAIKSGGRQFNIFVIAAGAGQINLRFEGGVWFCYDGPTPGGGWQTAINMNTAPLSPLPVSEDANGNGSLDDPGDTKNVFRLRITCLGWNSADPSFNLEIRDTNGGLIAANSGLRFFQNTIPATGGAAIEFTAQFGNSNGFWVDNVCVTALEAVVTGTLALTDVTANGDDVIVTWNDIGASGFSVERSTDGQSFTTIASGLSGNTFTDVGALAGGDAFAIYRVFLP